MEVPIAQARDQLGFLVDRVAHRGERMTLTRRGRRLVVVVSVEELARLDEIASSHGASVSGTPGTIRHADAGLSVPGGEISSP